MANKDSGIIAEEQGAIPPPPDDAAPRIPEDSLPSARGEPTSVTQEAGKRQKQESPPVKAVTPKEVFSSKEAPQHSNKFTMTTPASFLKIPAAGRCTGCRVRLGICAMDKKARSKPMAEILSRLDEELFCVVFFGDDTILHQTVERVARVRRADCLFQQGISTAQG